MPRSNPEKCWVLSSSTFKAEKRMFSPWPFSKWTGPLPFSQTATNILMFVNGQHWLSWHTWYPCQNPLLLAVFWNGELQIYFGVKDNLLSSVQQVKSNNNFPNNVQSGNLTVNMLLLPQAVSLDFEVVITFAKPHFIGLPTDLHIDCKLTSRESCDWGPH